MKLRATHTPEGDWLMMFAARETIIVPCVCNIAIGLSVYHYYHQQTTPAAVFSFPKRPFGKKNIVHSLFQASWFTS